MISYITIGGIGSRLKNISPLDKHLLYYKDKKIIEWIKNIIPNASILGEKKTNNRQETLYLISELHDVLIIDCDIIPFGFNESVISYNIDNLFVFDSNKNKYGSVILDNQNYLIKSSESNNISNTKCSGIYYIKNMKKMLQNMTDKNSIASGMIGAKAIYENTFLRFGDIEDYNISIGVK